MCVLSQLRRAAGNGEISLDGGMLPQWRKDGAELFYRTEDTKMMAVDVKIGAAFRAGVPHRLFETKSNGITQSYAVTANGQRFLVPVLADAPDHPSASVIVNWTKVLKQ